MADVDLLQTTTPDAAPPPSGGSDGGDRPSSAQREDRRQTQLAPDPRHRGKLRDQLRAGFDGARDPDSKLAPRKGDAAPAAAAGEARPGKGGVAARLAAADGGKDKGSGTKTAAAPAAGASAAETSPATGDEKTSTADGGTVAAGSTPALEPPSSWSKEAKDAWPTLPPPAQAAVAKREKEIADGLAATKQRWSEVEQALAPRRQLLSQSGHSEGAAINQLFAWHEALAGPRRLDAFRALAQSHNVDINQLVPQRQAAPTQQNQTNPSAQAGGQQPGQTGDVDPVQAYLQQYLQPVLSKIDGLATSVGGVQSAWQRQQNEAVARELESFAKERPHFESVRRHMGQLMSPTLDRAGNVVAAPAANSLQQAYDMAVWSHPETRAALQAEESTKRDAELRAAQAAEAKRAADEAAERTTREAEAEEARKKREADAVEKARRANVSVRGSGPASGLTHAGSSKGETVGSTLRNAIREQRTAI